MHGPVVAGGAGPPVAGVVIVGWVVVELGLAKADVQANAGVLHAHQVGHISRVARHIHRGGLVIAQEK